MGQWGFCVQVPVWGCDLVHFSTQRACLCAAGAGDRDLSVSRGLAGDWGGGWLEAEASGPSGEGGATGFVVSGPSVRSCPSSSESFEWT